MVTHSFSVHSYTLHFGQQTNIIPQISANNLYGLTQRVLIFIYYFSRTFNVYVNGIQSSFSTERPLIVHLLTSRMFLFWTKKK